MSGDTPEPAPEAPAAKPETKRFRKRFDTPRLAEDAAIRQGKLATLAWEVLGRDAAVTFLNNHDDSLGGRPIDLAVASAEGLAQVVTLLEARKS